MKTLHSLPALAAVILLFTVAPMLQAGPPPDYQNRMRSVVSRPAQTKILAKADTKKIPALCAKMPHCGCAAMTSKKAGS